MTTSDARDRKPVALVVGAGDFIGSAIARRFAQAAPIATAHEIVYRGALILFSGSSR